MVDFCKFCVELIVKSENKINSDKKGIHCSNPACRKKALAQFCSEEFMPILPPAESNLRPLLGDESDSPFDDSDSISSGEESF